MKVEEVIIIGAGPAGLAAAIQLKRFGIHPLLFERAKSGGLLHNANLVENYPGFPRGIRGPALVKLFVQQAENLGIGITYENVIELSYEQGRFMARTEGESYTSKLAVIATGTMPLRIIGLSIPEDLTERVFYEVVDLLEVKHKCIVIVGSGDAAFDYALNLSHKNQVTILNRDERPKCLPLLWERSQKVSGITYRNNTEVYQLTKDAFDGMLLGCTTPAGVLQYKADYLVGAIGREACLDCMSEAFLQQAQELDARGVLYTIGDVKNGIYRQTSIAVGDGVLAAMKICRQLKEMAR